MKLPLLFAALLLATGCASQGDDLSKSESPSSPREGEPATSVPGSTGASTHAAAAVASLKTLAQLVTPQKTLGFRSVSEVSSASLATPLPMLMVGLDDLRAYHAGDDPRPLLKNEGSFIYPVTVGGDVRSAMVIRQANGEWKATQFGRANLARFAHEGRQQVSLARGVAEAGVSLVEIPTMAARMLAHEEGGVPMLTALLDVPGTDIRAGATAPAADVFAKLHPLAEQNDGKAPN
jgi:hypothetical protein